MRDLSVVLVNYRCEAHTLAAVDHLERTLLTLPAATVVVDNSPAGDLGAALEHRYRGVRYLPMSSNVGFAAAANTGVAATSTPDLLLLNPDARPLPGCVEGLVGQLRDGSSVAAAGPVLLPMDDRRPRQPSATAVDPGIATALVEYTAAHRLVGRHWLSRHYFLSPDAESGAGAVDCAMVQGACLALRREAFDAVGGFDSERFFLYWEETDLERRMRRAGWRVVYCRELGCRHLGGASLGPGRTLHEGHFWRGFYAYHRKHGGLARELLLRVLLVPGIAAELGVLLLISALRRHTDPRLDDDLASCRRRLRLQLPGAGDAEAG